MKFFNRKSRLIIAPYTSPAAMPSATLFGQNLVDTLSGFDISGLDCEFQAKRTIVPMQPNSLKLRVFNLNSDHRKVQENGRIRLIFEAGYEDDTVQIFNGQVRSAWSAKEGADWVTYFDTGDSFMEVALANLNVSMGPREPLARVMSEVAKSLGVKTGNLNYMLAKLGSKAMAVFGKRTVLTGGAANYMTNLCDSAGLEWSVQDGELQILEKGKPLDGTGVLLTPTTGLIDSPSLELKSAGSFSNTVAIAKSVALSKPGHVVTANCLINPGLRVGGKVMFDCEEVKGAYKIMELEYRGQTRGKEWYVKLTGSHLNTAPGQPFI